MNGNYGWKYLPVFYIQHEDGLDILDVVHVDSVYVDEDAHTVDDHEDVVDVDEDQDVDLDILDDVHEVVVDEDHDEDVVDVDVLNDHDQDVDEQEDDHDHENVHVHMDIAVDDDVWPYIQRVVVVYNMLLVEL